MIVRHRGHDVRVPLPEAFVVLKLLVIPKRKGDQKRAKDILTVREPGGFLARQPDANARFRAIVCAIPKKWRRTALSADAPCAYVDGLTASRAHAPACADSPPSPGGPSSMSQPEPTFLFRLFE